jgi:hypothetical protein
MIGKSVSPSMGSEHTPVSKIVACCVADDKANHISAFALPHFQASIARFFRNRSQSVSKITPYPRSEMSMFTWRGEIHNSVWQWRLIFLLVQLIQYQKASQCKPPVWLRSRHHLLLPKSYKPGAVELSLAIPAGAERSSPSRITSYQEAKTLVISHIYCAASISHKFFPVLRNVEHWVD